ncbi:MAG: hypothetical protein QXG25_02275 [Nitrososphaerota archaeon]
MAARGKFPTCIVCGRPGIPLQVSGKDVIICVECAPQLHQVLGSLLAAMGASKGRVAAKKKAAAPLEELKEMIVKAVEERGSASLFEYCRRYGISRKDVRALAEELSKERGWAVEEVGGKLYLKKAVTA